MSSTMNNEPFSTPSFEELVREVNSHDAGHLVVCDRAFPSGYTILKFYQGDSAVGKITIDEIDDDTAFRVKSVLDFLANASHTVVYQIEIEGVFDNADPSNAPNSNSL